MSKREWWIFTGYQLDEEQVLDYEPHNFNSEHNERIHVIAKADAEAQEAQLVELVRELSAVIDRAMYLERLGNGSTAAWAAEALENARAKLTELNISTEGEK